MRGTSPAGTEVSDSDPSHYYVNSSPIADPGPEQFISADPNCQAEVTLDGSQSSDLDADPLTFAWDGPTGTLNGALQMVTLPQGDHLFTLTVEDGNGGSDSAQVEVHARDHTPPEIFLEGLESLALACGLKSFPDPGALAYDNYSTDVAVVVGGAVVDPTLP